MNMKNTKTKTQFPKDHPYMIRLDEVLSHYFVLKTIDPAVHGEDYEEMKEEILDSLFLNYLGQHISK